MMNPGVNFLIYFLKHLASEAIRMTYADIHGVTVDIEKKFTLIMGG